jgi:hypothetical protein
MRTASDICLRLRPAGSSGIASEMGATTIAESVELRSDGEMVMHLESARFRGSLRIN